MKKYALEIIIFGYLAAAFVYLAIINNTTLE